MEITKNKRQANEFVQNPCDGKCFFAGRLDRADRDVLNYNSVWLRYTSLLGGISEMTALKVT